MPFSEIASAALSSASSLLQQWLPGGQQRGHEYLSTNPLRADSKPGSFSINVNTGAWGDFATDAKGGDLISLYAYLNDLDQYDAAIAVAELVGVDLPSAHKRPDQPAVRKTPRPAPQPVAVKPASRSPWVPILPVPDDAPEPHAAHPRRGRPVARWQYRDADGRTLGWVYRFATSDGGKETIPHTFCKHADTGATEWRWLQFPVPRPLYGLDRLAARPDAWVLLVEGEKCADAPVDLLPHAVVVSWPGGSKAVGKVDWRPLAGRKIFAWADCDAQRQPLPKSQADGNADAQPLLPEHEQPGMKAMLDIRERLIALDPATDFKLVDIPAPGEKSAGWDVADAVADGISASALAKFIARTRADLPAAPAAAEKTLQTPNSATAEGGDDTHDWRSFMLRTKGGGLEACLANVYDILTNDPRWQGVLVYDEFAQRVIKRRRPPFFGKAGEEGEWTEPDDAQVAMWITRVYRVNISPALAATAVESAARQNTVNPPRDWMMGLKWDGSHRVDTWLLDYMGVPLNDYSKRVARWFLMGMVKRVFDPGCKFDYCLVLEGAQGRKKSGAMAVLGGEWFGDTDLDLSNKDSMSALRGKILYEFAELGSLARAEERRQKSFLSRRVDEFRPVYGRREIKQLRQLVFCGTTNEWEWNKDATGGRRFWPVRVEQEIDLDGLSAAREQLFAEAVEMVNAGIRYWPTSQEQAELFDHEQLARIIPDSLVDALHDHVMTYQLEFSLHYAATEWLKLDISKLTRDMQTRIGSALRQLGCTKHEKRGNALSRFWYKAPAIKEPTSAGDIPPAAEGDDDDFPF